MKNVIDSLEGEVQGSKYADRLCELSVCVSL